MPMMGSDVKYGTGVDGRSKPRSGEEEVSFLAPLHLPRSCHSDNEEEDECQGPNCELPSPFLSTVEQQQHLLCPALLQEDGSLSLFLPSLGCRKPSIREEGLHSVGVMTT